jgi:alpha-N-acetylglucosamine transferase
VAFVTSSVQYARPVLAAYGWRVLEKALPVELDEIQNKEYAQNMKDSGCCGADEFLKLWAYTLTEYHRVVHLDMDSIVFKNMVC